MFLGCMVCYVDLKLKKLLEVVVYKFVSESVLGVCY